MNNFILLFINALSHVGVFTKAEAEALCKEMQSSTLPDSFEASHRLVGQIFAKLELAPRLAEKELKKPIADVEKVLEKPVKAVEDLLKKPTPKTPTTPPATPAK